MPLFAPVTVMEKELTGRGSVKPGLLIREGSKSINPFADALLPKAAPDHCKANCAALAGLNTLLMESPLTTKPVTRPILLKFIKSHKGTLKQYHIFVKRS